MVKLTEGDVRQLTEEAIKQLGSRATPATVEEVVKEAIERISPLKTEKPVDPSPLTRAAGKRGSHRIIVTAFGKNQIGILAGLTSVLAQYQCDILDLTQKLLQEFFTIMILVDISKSPVDFEQLKTEITHKGEEFDLKVVIQHEEIFNTMHRI